MKRMIQLTAVLLSVILLVGCGGGASSEMAAASAPAAAALEAPKEMMDMSLTTDNSAGGANWKTDDSGVYNDPNAKLIREGNLNIQTTEFDLAVEELETLVNYLGGYFQNASLHGGNYRNVNANRTGEYTIRVPSEKYVEFMGQAGNLGYVTYRNETTRNIGEQYYDTQARLKTQKTKQERLLSLLERAETMEDIISLESALSEVEYEIEQLSSTLNRYDSLVGFSTIHLTLNEVHKVTEETGVTNTLGQRMEKGFRSSVEGAVEGFQELLVWFSYHVFGLLIAAVVIGLGGVCVLRMARKKKRARTIGDSEEKK